MKTQWKVTQKLTNQDVVKFKSGMQSQNRPLAIVVDYSSSFFIFYYIDWGDLRNFLVFPHCRTSPLRSTIKCTLDKNNNIVNGDREDDRSWRVLYPKLLSDFLIRININHTDVQALDQVYWGIKRNNKLSKKKQINLKANLIKYDVLKILQKNLNIVSLKSKINKWSTSRSLTNLVH